ncbi:Na+/H+ antiporter subunit E [Knoellia locipacati]|uniref:Na+/H+ antiporter subunit E n=1 Tax=Knoellia locipacati TaxID=882824 RepID=UPI003850AB63
MSGALPMVVGLTLIWVLLWGAVTPTVVVGGVLASVLVVTVFPFPKAPWTWVVRPWPTLVLAVRFFWDLVRASIEVSWFALRPSGPPPSAILRVGLRTRSELVMTITSELVCLVPGSLLVELVPEEGAIYLHVMDARTPERVAAFHQSVLDQEERVVKAFAPREERDAVCSQEAAP